MHRIAGDDMNPTVDTAAKLSCFRFFPGANVLDTCMGLGRYLLYCTLSDQPQPHEHILSFPTPINLLILLIHHLLTPLPSFPILPSPSFLPSFLHISV